LQSVTEYLSMAFDEVAREAALLREKAARVEAEGLPVESGDMAGGS